MNISTAIARKRTRRAGRPLGPRVTKSPRASVLRSLVKTVTYRFVSTIYTVALGYFIFGSIEAALSFGVIDVFANSAVYLGHERLWAWIDLRQKVQS